MPIYEYKCTECGKQIEKMQKISEAPLTVCENCGGPLEKQWSLSGFQFKGEGWYVTDYSGKGKPDAKSETKTGKSEPAEKSSEKSSTEKSSAAESTAKPDAASNKSETKTTSKE